VTLNFNNDMSTAVVFLDIEKAFDTTWHIGLLCRLPNYIFGKIYEAQQLILNTQKFQILGRRQIIHAQKNISRGDKRLRPEPYPI